MKLYCVRHGHAEQLPDKNDEYPLSQQGEMEVNKMAIYLARQGIHVARVMHSGKLRAAQTANCFTQLLGTGVTESCTYLNANNAIDPLLALIQTWHDDTLLVGHMPFMSQLVSALLLGNQSYHIVRFSQGTVVCLDRFEPQRWIVEWVLRPDLVLNGE